MSRVFFLSRRFLQQCSTRRHYSNPAESTSRVASDWLSRITARGPVAKTQYIDANQLQLLSLTLNRPNVHPGVAVDRSLPPKGTPIPPGYHLAYFTVPILEKELGFDGTDTSYNPDAPFTRRMWAGGEVKWVGGDKNPLRVGQEVQETTQILSAEAKVTKRGEEMIVVGLEKRFENRGGVAVIDNRNWVFRKALTKPQPLPPTPAAVDPPSGTFTKDLKQTDVTLFRFSALTFNGHKIHYSLPWCREVEGHRGLVVHGPLNHISILDFWRDTRKDGESQVPASVAYRATSPLYAGEPYRIVLDYQGEGRVEGTIYGLDRTVCMKADIISQACTQ